MSDQLTVMIEISAVSYGAQATGALRAVTARVTADLQDALEAVVGLHVRKDSKPAFGSELPSWPGQIQILHAPHPTDLVLIVEGSLALLLQSAELALTWWQIHRQAVRSSRGKLKLKIWYDNGRSMIDLDAENLTTAQLKEILKAGLDQ